MIMKRPRKRQRLSSNLKSTEAQISVQVSDSTTPADGHFSLFEDDFLVDLFLQAISSTWKAREGCISHKAFPFVLSQVCTRWRRLAKSDQRLWTHVHVCFPLQPYLVDLWLMRSYPKSIDLALSTVYDEVDVRSDGMVFSEVAKKLEEGGEVKKLMNDFQDLVFDRVLAPYLTRCKTISILNDRKDWPTRYTPLCCFIQLIDPTHLIQYFHRYSHPLPLLEIFSFSEISRGFLQERKILFPNGTPSLIKAVIGHPLNLPSTHLRELVLSACCVPISDLHASIQNCSVLETLVLHGHLLDYSDSLEFDLENLRPLQLDRLTTLSLCGSWSLNVFPLLKLFRNTSCRHISINRIWWKLTSVHHSNGLIAIADDDVLSRTVTRYKSTPPGFKLLETLKVRFYQERKKEKLDSAMQLRVVSALWCFFPLVCGSVQLLDINNANVPVLNGIRPWPHLLALVERGVRRGYKQDVDSVSPTVVSS